MKLELIDVSKSYNNITVLNKINLKISSPGLYFLKGENGSGKTTLLNLIASFASIDEGEIKINNESVCLDTNKKYISFYDTDINLLDEITIEENLKLINDNYLDLVNEYNLGYLLKKKVNEISKGEKARVGIIKTLLSNKPILLFDEPFAYLDQNTAKIFYELIKRYSKNHIIIFTNHFSELDLNNINTIELNSNGIKCDLVFNNEFDCDFKKTKSHGSFKNSFKGLKKVKVKCILTSLFLSLCVATLIPSLNFSLTSKKELFNEIANKEGVLYASIDSDDKEILSEYNKSSNYSKEIKSVSYIFKEEVKNIPLPTLYVTKGEELKFNDSIYDFKSKDIYVTKSALPLVRKMDGFTFTNLFNHDSRNIKLNDVGIIEEVTKNDAIFINEKALHDYLKKSSYFVNAESLNLDKILDTSILNKCLLTSLSIIKNEVLIESKINDVLGNNEAIILLPDKEKNNQSLINKVEGILDHEFTFNDVITNKTFNLFSYIPSIKIKGYKYLDSDYFPLTGAPFGLIINDNLYDEIGKINANINPLSDGSNNFLITANNLTLLNVEEYNQFYTYVNKDETNINIDKFNALEAKDFIQIIFILIAFILLFVSIYFMVIYSINFIKQNKLNNYVLYVNGSTKKDVFVQNLVPLIFINSIGITLGSVLSVPLSYLMNLLLNTYSNNVIFINYFPFNIYQFIITFSATIIMLLVVVFNTYKINGFKEVSELKSNN